MRAVDTNILVRLVTRDDPRQLAVAETFVAKGAWVSHLVLAELVWVLDSVYGLKDAQLVTAIEMLLAHRQLMVQDPDVVMAALTLFKRQPAGSFSDYLVLEIARRAGHLPLGTFDRRLAKADGAQAI